ncbi:MAG: 2-C-methyl-D-erythritol 2,4-cyclodiphosphate synthase [Clostridiales Family XIII bacterium]|jgi:2-C-methyl-D-erythritol 4-phosphate cytidylyltransferase/2-C-methyl-D-erythritol 2,4-cyclodiphosphate synthase|nr:2-C-methyl-D-erythritol 2,4-cyclodiphosphate synthase [Clostridiales Family XIII bacterium]
MYGGRKVAALIAAGGAGSRFGMGPPKQFANTGGEPMLVRAARPFLLHEAVDEIIFIVPEGNAEDALAHLAAAFQAGPEACADKPGYRVFSVEENTKPKGLVCVTGGDSRQASVKNGLEAVSFEDGLVLIHDAARPFVTRAVIDAVLEAAAESGAAAPGIPVTDTLYKADEGITETGSMAVLEIPDRRQFFAAQTPQGFDLRLIAGAHRKAAAEGYEATDDAAVAMRCGAAKITIVAGDPANRKITYAADLDTAEAGGAHERRVGTGFDVHAFADGRKLILGGVEIPFERGLLGHSDADVLTHALMDALLGALALGDIGAHFPDTDEKYRGISSMELLAEVMGLVTGRGFRPVNADLTVIAERPKISSYREKIAASLAAALGLERDCVSVKATTTEGLGFCGREEGIGAMAVALVERV